MTNRWDACIQSVLLSSFTFHVYSHSLLWISYIQYVWNVSFIRMGMKMFQLLLPDWGTLWSSFLTTSYCTSYRGAVPGAEIFHLCSLPTPSWLQLNRECSKVGEPAPSYHLACIVALLWEMLRGSTFGFERGHVCSSLAECAAAVHRPWMWVVVSFV